MLSVRTFLARHPIKRNDIRSIARTGAQALPDGIIADIEKLLGVMSVISDSRIPEVTLKPQTVPTRQQSFKVSDHSR